jgi:hypothetical protein
VTIRAAAYFLKFTRSSAIGRRTTSALVEPHLEAELRRHLVQRRARLIHGFGGLDPGDGGVQLAAHSAGHLLGDGVEMALDEDRDHHRLQQQDRQQQDQQGPAEQAFRQASRSRRGCAG